MQSLPERALLRYIFASQQLQGTDDILSGLIPFLKPVLEETGQSKPIDANKFALSLNALYGWNTSGDVVEEFLPRLVKAGWALQSKVGKKVAYIVTENGANQVSYESEHVNAIIDSIEKRFKLFCDEFSSHTINSLNINNYSNTILTWLAYRDVIYSNSIRGDTLNGERVSGRSKEDQKRIDYICARFVEAMSTDDPNFFQQMVGISSAAMLAEIVIDIGHPPVTKLRKGHLTVYADGPFLMCALGASGKSLQKNAINVVESLISIGAEIFVLQHSCDEISGNIMGVLNLQNHQRFGPTADALRRGDVREDLLRAMARDPIFFSEKIGVKPDKYYEANQNIGSNYFPQTAVTELESDFNQDGEGDEIYVAVEEAIAWKQQARERDARSIAHVMRRRIGHRTTNVLDSRFILLTMNAKLCRIANQVCVKSCRISRHQVPPAIHQRTLASVLWLTLGVSHRTEFASSHLLAACSKILASNNGVIQTMRSTIKNIDEVRAKELDVLLSRPRSMQILMDASLGVPEVITDRDSVERIFDMIKQATAEEVTTAKDAEISALKGQMSIMTDQLARTRAQDEESINSWRAKADLVTHRWKMAPRYVGFIGALASLLAAGGLVLIGRGAVWEFIALAGTGASFAWRCYSDWSPRWYNNFIAKRRTAVILRLEKETSRHDFADRLLRDKGDKP